MAMFPVAVKIFIGRAIRNRKGRLNFFSNHAGINALPGSQSISHNVHAQLTHVNDIGVIWAVIKPNRFPKKPSGVKFFHCWNWEALNTERGVPHSSRKTATDVECLAFGRVEEQRDLFKEIDCGTNQGYFADEPGCRRGGLNRQQRQVRGGIPDSTHKGGVATTLGADNFPVNGERHCKQSILPSNCRSNG
ncbi:hypothetical protein CDAR_567321 [Caerostris darwini]|uniref:Uncharacterized protein n=1 Tax=Caerostris darwini TaxID=1538125 RepID=A0AAV4QWG9_9ARAC|nr:hypothetical protein CDAR_567321 [Caerostris darwini]